MEELTQQELLLALKAALDATWDEVAAKTGIVPRTLKSYRLPEDSSGNRGMDKFVRGAVEKLFMQAQKNAKKTA